MRPILTVLLAGALGASLIACDDVRPTGAGDEDVSSGDCVTGQSSFCNCAGGGVGVMTCAAGSYGPCDCTVEFVDAGADADPFIDIVLPDISNEPTCGPNRYRYDDDDDDKLMFPGEACIACHLEEREGPRFAAAGTVMPNLHEDEGCVGRQGVIVEITGADGTTRRATTNRTGNFYFDRSIAKPYTARVIDGDVVREMNEPQTNGDCNSCHTPFGEEGAAGRIW